MDDQNPRVEAGAKAAYDHAMKTTRAFAAPWAVAALSDMLGATWDEMAEERRAHYRSLARDVIDAYEGAAL